MEKQNETKNESKWLSPTKKFDIQKEKVRELKEQLNRSVFELQDLGCTAHRSKECSIFLISVGIPSIFYSCHSANPIIKPEELMDAQIKRLLDANSLDYVGEYMEIDMASKILSLTKRTISRWVKNKILEGYRYGQSYHHTYIKTVSVKECWEHIKKVGRQ